MDTLQLHALEQALPRMWSAETSSDPESWTTANPSWGQCAVTACLVQDLLGGDIVWAEARLPDGRPINHYFNVVDGLVIDLTRVQFPNGTEVPAGVDKRKSFNSTREYVLSFDATRTRYQALRAAWSRETQAN